MIVVVGVENNGKDGEGSLQDGKLEGAKFEQEERASGDETEETISLSLLMTRNNLTSDLQ